MALMTGYFRFTADCIIFRALLRFLRPMFPRLFCMKTKDLACM